MAPALTEVVQLVTPDHPWPFGAELIPFVRNTNRVADHGKERHRNLPG
jgi:hypothetical protein